MANKNVINQSLGNAGYPMPLLAELLLTILKRTARYFLSSGLSTRSIAHLLAMGFEHLGKRKSAAVIYEWALENLDRSLSPRIFRVRQHWQFRTERNYARMGSARVEDPLFSCTVQVDQKIRQHGRMRRRAAGYYDAYFTHRGLRVDGFLRPGLGRVQLELLIDGRVIRRTTASLLPFSLPIFVLSVKRDALKNLPKSSLLTLRLTSGEILLLKGCAEALLNVPHGNHTEHSAHEVRTDKKGFLILGNSEISNIRLAFLEIYRRANDFYEAHFGTPLFIMYGTLLGQRRSKDFIPGDDDFDVGYYTDAVRSKDVRTEGMNMVVSLVRAGFIVSINRSGRLFRLRLPGMPPVCHLDVHAIWREHGSLWIHPRANLNIHREDFLPACKATFHNQEVMVPARPEAFLAAYYGNDWRRPNPAYSTASRPFPRWKSQQLRKSFITPKHLKIMQERIAQTPKDDAKKGLLIAYGMQSLYPLDKYEELCDW